MTNLKFQTRIIIGFLVIIFISIITSLYTIKNTKSISKNTKLIFEHPYIVSNASRDINIYITSINKSAKDFITAKDSIEHSLAKVEILYFDSLTHIAFSKIQTQFLGDKKIVDETYNEYINWYNLILKFITNKNYKSSYNITTYNEIPLKANLLLKKTQYLIDFAQSKAEEFKEQTITQEEKSIFTTIAFTSILLLISIISSLVISRSIASPIKTFIKKLNDIHKSDTNKETTTLSEQQILTTTIESLQTAYTRLENFNLELDKKVDERTTELRKNEELLSEKIEEYLSLNEEYNEKNNEYLALNEEYKTQNEHLLTAKEKAEESDKLKSAFLANMSHEIRTPMNAILGFTSLLNNKSLTEEKRAEYISLIQNGGKRLLRLITDIVDISKIDAKQLSLSYSACNINELIDNLKSQFSLYSSKNQITLITHKGLKDTESVIQTDEIRLSQILSNLLENAQKYTDSGSIEFGYEKKGSVLEFYVKDSGIGISQKNTKKIFDRFMQVETEYAKSISGTGLGLAIVKGILDLFDGEIWVTSEENIGTTFFFTIPYITEAISKKENIAFTKLEPSQRTKILIAEDEDSNFFLLQELLNSEKFKITRAHNGQEAVNIFKENSEFDLIFMDIKMPILNGIEATQQIRKFNSKIPIIAQTAYAMAEEKTKILKAGCSSYLTKPIMEDALNRVIAKYI